MKRNAFRFDQERSRQIDIEVGEKVGEGAYGAAEKVRVKAGKGKERGLVRKVFKNGEADAVHAVEMYGLLKKAGLVNIPTTYRLLGEPGRQSGEVLMTDYRVGGNIIFSGNEDKAQNIAIDEIQDVDAMLASLDADLKKAAHARIWITSDAYWIIGSKKGGSFPARVVIADFDGSEISHQDNGVTEKDIYRFNTFNLFDALTHILKPRMEASGEKYRELHSKLLTWAHPEVTEKRFDARAS